MVWMWEICRREDKEFQREEVNWVPLSVARVCRTPKQEIQKEMNASAQEEEEMEERGAASIQQVVLSIMARMWELSWEMGRSPTMSDMVKTTFWNVDGRHAGGFLLFGKEVIGGTID